MSSCSETMRGTKACFPYSMTLPRELWLYVVDMLPDRDLHRLYHLNSMFLYCYTQRVLFCLRISSRRENERVRTTDRRRLFSLSDSESKLVKRLDYHGDPNNVRFLLRPMSFIWEHFRHYILGHRLSHDLFAHYHLQQIFRLENVEELSFTTPQAPGQLTSSSNDTSFLHSLLNKVRLRLKLLDLTLATWGAADVFLEPILDLNFPSLERFRLVGVQDVSKVPAFIRAHSMTLQGLEILSDLDFNALGDTHLPKLQDLSLPAYEGIYNQRLRDFITRHADQLSSLTITVSAQETGQHDWTVGSFACLNLPFPNLIRLVIYVQRGLPPHFELLRMITPHLPNLKAFAFQAYWMSRDDILALFGAPVGLETLEMEFEGFDFETASALQRSLPRLHRLKLILHTPSFDEAIKSLPPVSQSVSESGFIVNEELVEPSYDWSLKEVVLLYPHQIFEWAKRMGRFWGLMNEEYHQHHHIRTPELLLRMFPTVQEFNGMPRPVLAAVNSTPL